MLQCYTFKLLTVNISNSDTKLIGGHICSRRFSIISNILLAKLLHITFWLSWNITVQLQHIYLLYL